MKKKLIMAVMVLAPLYFSSCTRVLDEKEYLEWVLSDRSGYNTLVSIDNYDFSLLYTPILYLFLRDNDWKENQSQYQEYKKQKDGLTYFTLLIEERDILNRLVSENKSGATTSIEHLLQYFSYQFENHIYLLKDSQRVHPVLFHFERSSGNSNSLRFVLGFEKDGEEPETFLFKIDSPIFSSQPFSFQVNNLQNIDIQL